MDDESVGDVRRYRLPNGYSLRSMVIASLCGIVGSVEVIAWAALRAPVFVVQAGIALIAVGVVFLVTSIVTKRRAEWIAYVRGAGFSVARGDRRSQHRWDELNSVSMLSRSIVIYGRDGRVAERLLVSRFALASATLRELVHDLDDMIESA